MYRDKTLIPAEAIRMLTLGLLADKARKYADLAAEVRHFTSHVLGPSLDMLGPSIELLRHEGLANAREAPEAQDDDPQNPELAISDAGWVELNTLLTANVRVPVDDVSKLVIALKFRFLHLLEPSVRRDQIDDLATLYRSEQARLAELRLELTSDGSQLTDWLDHEIAQLDDRIAWLSARREAV